MNRRSILALIGFAPLATAAVALPRVADPVKLASTGGRQVSANAPFVFNDGVLYLDEVRINSLTEISRVLGSVDISNANIGRLICDSVNGAKK